METMLRNARITAQWDDGPERRDEAIRQVHLAMYRSALGQITADEREQILAVLRPCCPEIFVSPRRGTPAFSIPEPFAEAIEPTRTDLTCRPCSASPAVLTHKSANVRTIGRLFLEEEQSDLGDPLLFDSPAPLGQLWPKIRMVAPLQVRQYFLCHPLNALDEFNFRFR